MKGRNEMDIYSSECFRGCLFVAGMRMNSGENGTRGEKIEEREEGGGRGGSEVRPINKQRIDFLPLSAIPGKPARLHHPAALISTYVKDSPRGGGTPPSPLRSPLPLRLVNGVLWTSLGDGASEGTLAEIVPSDPGLCSQGDGVGGVGVSHGRRSALR